MFGLALRELPAAEKPGSEPAMGMPVRSDKKKGKGAQLYSLVSQLPPCEQLTQAQDGEQVEASAARAGSGASAGGPLITVDPTTQARWGLLATILGAIYISNPRHEMKQGVCVVCVPVPVRVPVPACTCACLRVCIHMTAADYAVHTLCFLLLQLNFGCFWASLVLPRQTMLEASGLTD